MKNIETEAKKKGRKNKLAKPQSVEKTIIKLAEEGATNKSIAAFYEMDENTLARNYEIFLTKGRENLKMKLRKKQIQVALKGNVIMLIWCGKQFADQTEKSNEDVRVVLSATHKTIE